MFPERTPYTLFNTHLMTATRFLLLFVCLLFTLGLRAQVPPARTDSILMANDSVFMVPYREVRSNAELLALAADQRTDRYPIVIMNRRRYELLKEAVATQNKIIRSHAQLDTAMTIMSNLQKQQGAAYNELLSLENERAEMFKKSTQELLTESQKLNAELTNSLALLKDNIRGMQRRNLKAILIGGVIGLTTGVLTGVIVGN